MLYLMKLAPPGFLGEKKSISGLTTGKSAVVFVDKSSAEEKRKSGNRTLI